MTLEEAIAEVEDCIANGLWLGKLPVGILLDYVKAAEAPCLNHDWGTDNRCIHCGVT